MLRKLGQRLLPKITMEHVLKASRLYIYSGLPTATESLIVQQNPCCSVIVVHKAYCCSVVTVNSKNNVQCLTLRYSTGLAGRENSDF